MVRPEVGLISRTRDELSTLARGERRWSKVEVSGERWFQVETRGEKRDPFRTYILPDVDSALDLLASLRRDSWTQLRLYTRLLPTIVDGYIFETVRQVYVTPDGTHLFLLKSGLILCDSDNGRARGASLAEAEEIYSHMGHSA